MGYTTPRTNDTFTAQTMSLLLKSNCSLYDVWYMRIYLYYVYTVNPPRFNTVQNMAVLGKRMNFV